MKYTIKRHLEVNEDDINWIALVHGFCQCFLQLFEVGFFQAATPQATVTTGGLNQVKVSGVVYASIPGMSDSRTSNLPPLKKSYCEGDSNPCARNFNSRIGLVVHLRIHRTEAGEPVPGAATYSRRARLHCPHCSRTFTHRMGLLGHMRLHDNLR
ncbi:unnamed protein product [Schistocephalus solidus]|uniref:C2H2-type domain-containing protein n=1 Tax=Schistocephalus solidus TaxID=70667 RepID=A0A183SED1_SCHSO|nr:unnamed protein product [Schistocephalus solidus]